MNATRDYRVRPAHPADAALIADWQVAMALETEDKRLDPATVIAGVAGGIAQPSKARYFIAMHDASFAGAETIGVPVGGLMLTTEWSDWRNGEWWWIQSVFVPPEHRRHGVYTALHRHVEALARDTPGVVGLRLTVERDNANARRTYEALGMHDENYRVFCTLF